MPKEIIIEKELLEQLYFGNGYTLEQIKELLNIGECTLYRKMDKYGIERFWRDEFEISDEELKKLYYEDNLTILEIAKKIGCSKTGVRWKFSRSNIPIKINYRKGRKKSLEQRKRCSNTRKKLYKEGKIKPWNKGIGIGSGYTSEFHQIKDKIYLFYGRICNLCGSNKHLCIHHIDYNKKNNQLHNLIPLCTHCHGRTNGHRDHWYNIFVLGLYQKPKEYIEYLDKTLDLNEEDLLCYS